MRKVGDLSKKFLPSLALDMHCSECQVAQTVLWGCYWRWRSGTCFHCAFAMCFLVTAFYWVAVLHLDLVPDKPLSSEFSVLSFLFHQCRKDFLFIFFLSFRGGLRAGNTLLQMYIILLLYYIISFGTVSFTWTYRYLMRRGGPDVWKLPLFPFPHCLCRQL